MKKIGVTFSHHHWPQDADNRRRIQAYLDAVAFAGATAEPLWLPDGESQSREYSQRLAGEYNGLLISGGADLPPQMYGETVLENAGVSLVTEERPRFELALLENFFAAGKPIFGICYGCQILNVWRGGTLLQDIDAQWENPILHSAFPKNALHHVRVLADTKLREIVGAEEFEIVSSHHQAIKEVGAGAHVSSYAPDRLAESVEFDGDEFCLGVQWHPERSMESAASQNLFRAFVDAC